MAGIIAHTVGVIAAAGSGGSSSTEHNVTVGALSGVTDVWGYTSGGDGSIDNAATGGNTIDEISSGGNSSSREDFRFSLASGSPAQDFFDNIVVETGAGTVTLNSADASSFSSSTRTWFWSNSSIGQVVWDSGDENQVRKVTVNYS